MSSASGSSRRDFLKTGASFVALTATVPAFLQQTVEAATRTGRSGKFRDGERILVVVQLAGGNDGLNTIVPVTNDLYYRARPQLAISAGDALRLDDDFGFHPATAGLKTLYDAGYLSIIHAAGYPNPNRSHFKSMDIWQTASPGGRIHEGWLGRYFDNACRGSDGCGPTAGIALMPESPLAMRGRRFLPLAFRRPEALRWGAAVRPAATGRVVTALNQPQPGDARAPRDKLEYLRRVALEARLSAEMIQSAVGERRAGDGFPRSDIGQSLYTVSRLIGAGIRCRVYYVSQGGYDTHANQAGRQQRRLKELGDAVVAFVNALRNQGELDRVLLMTFSEFGRRVAENGSGGTDHGAAGPMCLVGGRVRPGLHGPAADLGNLENGDLKHTVDFRSVYATVLKRWLRTDPVRLLGGDYPRLDVIR